MSRFTAPLVVTPSEDYKAWHVQHSTSIDAIREDVASLPFGYDIGEEGSGLSIEVPSGFRTDFASIPWFARWLIPTWGRHTNAAIIHDWLYSGLGRIEVEALRLRRQGYRGVLLSTGIDCPYPTRKQADGIMLEGMEVMGVARWMRLAIYAGLRIGGWWAWRKKRR